MADSGGERTKTRDVDDLLADVDDITADDTADAGPADRDVDQGGLGSDHRRTRGETDHSGSGLRERATQLFSLRAFVAALVLVAIGVSVGRFVPLVGGLLGFVGVFLATFVLGLVGDRGHYVEAGVASAAIAGGWSAVGNVTLLAVGVGLPLVAVSAAVGLLTGLVGHYFGRDLRDGLTREI